MKILAAKENEEEIKRRFNNFVQKDLAQYPPEQQNYILNNFWKNVYKIDAPSIFLQIYNKLEIQHPLGNFYECHLKILKENFKLKGNILDVASGYIPAFGMHMAKQIKNNGTVTLYDPLLLKDQPLRKNMVLHKELFTKETDISSYDLITSILPCEVTELLLERVCEERKDFYIQLCSCPKTVPGIHFATVQDRWQYLIYSANELVKKYDNGQLALRFLPTEYNRSNPILMNRK